MSCSLACSLGVGRLLDRGSIDAIGTTGGILLFRDKRILYLFDMVIGVFFISCVDL